MADSFRKRARESVAMACDRFSFHPIRERQGAAKLLIALLLPLAVTSCRQAPQDNTPPDIIKQITMRKWDIVPNRIEIPRGDEVELVVNSTDIEHGIAIPKYGIREPVQPGTPTIVKFRAIEAGTFTMRCSVLCGRGHNQMVGQIVVVPAPGQSH